VNKDVEKTIKEMVLDMMELDIDKLDRNAHLFTISEWDSFHNLMLISLLEEKYNVILTLVDIGNASTINKLIDMIAEKKGWKDG